MAKKSRNGIRTMEENNNQNTTEIEVDSTNQNKLFSKLKQVRKKTLYIFLTVLLVAFGISGGINVAQMEQTDKLQNTIASLENDIDELNDKYETLVSENQELESEIQKYQDQQETIDNLNKKLTDLQSQYDAIIKENETLKSENASLKSQLEQKQASAQSSSSSGSSGTWRSGSNQSNDSGGMVWLSATGEKYHKISNCGRMNPNNARQVTKSAAEASGYEPCSKCY